jgi:hypothetical protein
MALAQEGFPRSGEGGVGVQRGRGPPQPLSPPYPVRPWWEPSAHNAGQGAPQARPWRNEDQT